MDAYDDELLSSYLRNRSRIVRYLRGKTGSQQDAEDLAQDAWIKFARNGRVAAAAPIAYLSRIAKTLALDHDRRRKRHLSSNEITELIEASDEAPSPERIVEDREQIRLLSKILAELPERQRTILVQVRVEQRHQLDIAADLGISTRTVEYDLRRALEYCSERLDRINRR